MNAVFLVFAAALIWLSYRSLRGGVDYVRFFKQELEHLPSGFTPFATILAPCRGTDPGLEENLKAVVTQDYPAFEVIFVVDDPDDPAVAMINKLLNNTSKLVVAPKAVAAGQKVENLRTAIQHADPSSELFVFVDSDVRPARSWLGNLAAPLANTTIGAATGYRWFISANPTFASELRCVWNASIASALGPRTGSNFCWGGSMAISRSRFEQLGILDRWKGAVSDDFIVTRALNEAALPIVFVPGALVASEGECTFLQMLEFTTRQMKITRVYAPHLWLSSLLGSTLFVGVILSALLILIFSNVMYARSLAAITLALVSAFSIGKSWLRLKAIQLVLTKYGNELKKQRLAQLSLWALTPAVFLYNSIRALLSRRIIWRGIAYELKSPTETVIISD